MPDKPRKPLLDTEQSVDYLVCRQCNTPCYTFEMEKGKLIEAQCLVCGNDDLILFNFGEDLPDE